MNSSAHGLYVVGLLLMAVMVSGCKDPSEVSEAQAKLHVVELARNVRSDVAEVRNGLPAGAECMAAFFNRESLGPEQGNDAREALSKCRNKVQDLRIAKSTFFVAASSDGLVIRNDRDQDLMAGKNLFSAYPELRQALTGKYVETQGSMPEAAGAKGRADAQWVAAQPVRVAGEVRGLYATGWSWAAYAYRLEFALRSSVLSSLRDRQKAPLVYVFVVVGQSAYGTPISPLINAQEVERQNPLAGATETVPFARRIEITGRPFGLAVIRTPSLGKDAGIAVLRSET